MASGQQNALLVDWVRDDRPIHAFGSQAPGRQRTRSGGDGQRRARARSANRWHRERTWYGPDDRGVMISIVGIIVPERTSGQEMLLILHVMPEYR